MALVKFRVVWEINCYLKLALDLTGRHSKDRVTKRHVVKARGLAKVLSDMFFPIFLNHIFVFVLFLEVKIYVAKCHTRVKSSKKVLRIEWPWPLKKCFVMFYFWTMGKTFMSIFCDWSSLRTSISELAVQFAFS